MESEGLPRRLRLRRRREYLRVQTTGRKHHTRHFLVFAAPVESNPARAGSDLPPTRLGITVTRKVGNAVVRNRIKRLVREVFRRNHGRFAPGLDLVWVAKRGAAGLELDAVQADLEQLLGRPELRAVGGSR